MEKKTHLNSYLKVSRAPEHYNHMCALRLLPKTVHVNVPAMITTFPPLQQR